jgi:hypothetical protein
MRILIVADFRQDSPHFLLNNPRIFGKGFVRNGHDVLEFSYRDMLSRLSPFSSKKLSVWWAKEKTDEMLIRLATHHQPELILVAAFKLLDGKTILRLRESFPKAVIVCWYCDPPHGIIPSVYDIGQHSDWFLATTGGELLREFKELGAAHCAFLPYPSDPDVQHPRETEARWHAPIVFTGKLMHGGKAGQDAARWELVELLVKERSMSVWGCLSSPFVKGADYLDAVCGADMALSINIYNESRFYHSDRLTHYVGCGTLTLVKQVPDSELLFEDGEHVCYFDSQEECLELVDRYAVDVPQREKIAEQGRRHTHERFHCQKLAKYIVDLAEKGEYQETWCEVV